MRRRWRTVSIGMSRGIFRQAGKGPSRDCGSLCKAISREPGEEKIPNSQKVWACRRKSKTNPLGRPRKSLTIGSALLKVGQTCSPNRIVAPRVVPTAMKNVYEVLRQKELELSRLEKEVEALRVAAPLLSDESAGEASGSKPTLTATTPAQQPIRIPQPAAASAPAVQSARAAGWEDNAKRWP
jgi:hypothetical protein